MTLFPLRMAAAGLLTAAALATAAAPPQVGLTVLDRLLGRFDTNGNGALERRECPPQMRRAFARLDRNRDGKLTLDEMRPMQGRLARFLGGSSPNSGRGEINTPAARGERKTDRLKVGDLAPDFSLPLIKGKGEVKLSACCGKRPTVLIFASYT